MVRKVWLTVWLLIAMCVVASIAWLPLTSRAVIVTAAHIPLCVAAGVDLVERRLPNRLVAMGAAVVLAGLAVVVGVERSAAGMSVVTSAVAGAAALSAPMLAVHLVSPEGIGFGDVKAGAVLGAITGLIDMSIAIVALALASFLTAVGALALRRRTVPFGPALVLGSALALVLARLVGVAPAQ